LKSEALNGKIRLNKYSMNFIITFTFCVLLVLSPNNFSLLVYSFVIFLSSLFFPSQFLIGWIFVLPFENYLLTNIGFSPYILIIPAIIYGYFSSKAIFNINNGIKINKKKTLLPIIYFSIIIFSMIINFHLPLRNLVSIIISFVLFILISGQNIKHKNYYFLSIICSALLSLFVAILTHEAGWRIDLGGNVRVIANIFGIAITILFYSIFYERRLQLNAPFKKNKIISLIFLVVLIFGLFSTVSRGVILSTIISAGIFILLMIIDSEIILSKKIIIVFSIVFLSIISLYILSFTQELITGDHLVDRFYLDEIERAIAGARFDIWFSPFEDIDYHQLIFGAGLGNFRNYGTGSYPHSVFIDIIFSTGFLGLSLWIIYLIILLKVFVFKKNIFGIILLVFLIFNFSTHGSLYNKYFWCLLYLTVIMS